MMARGTSVAQGTAAKAGGALLAGAAMLLGGTYGAVAQTWGDAVVTKAPPPVASAPTESVPLSRSYIPEPVVRVGQFASPRVLELSNATVTEQAWNPIVTGAIGGSEGAGTVTSPMVKPLTQKPAPPLAKSDEVNRKQPARRIAENGVEPPAAAAPAAGPAAAPAAPATPAAATAPPLKPLESLPPDATPVQQYCYNTTDAVADARTAWQAKKIADAEGELEKRIATLQAKTEEYKTWLTRRDEFIKRAHEKLVGVYTRMRPDAAAAQLQELDEETAAAIVTKLDIKAASVVMNEMQPEKAARIAAIISGSAKVKPTQVKAPVAAAPAAPVAPAQATSEPAAQGAKS